MKRELALAMEAQLQVTESLGRTRASKPDDLLQNVSTVNGSVDQSPKPMASITKCREINVYRRNKRLKISSENGDSVIVEKSKVDSVIVEAAPKVDCVEAPKIDSVVAELPKNESVIVEAPRIDSVIVEDSKIDSVIVEVPVAEVDSEIKAEAMDNFVTPAAKRRKKKKKALCGGSRRFTRSILNVQPVETMEREHKKEDDVDDVAAVAEGNLTEVPVEAIGNVTELEPRKIELSRRPTNVKELFETGMLEDYAVFYNGTGNKESALRGIIKGTGILCFCSLCKGSRVVPPSAFEVHACKVYKRASQYICFENGKSLLEVVKLCNKYALKTLATDIQNIVGPLIRKKIIICQSCKGSFILNTAGNVEHICEPCMHLANLQNNSTQTTELEARYCEQDLDPLSPRRDSLRDNKRGSSQSTKIKRKSSRAVLDPVSPVSALSNKSSQIKSKRKPIKKMVSVKTTPRLNKSRGKLLGKTSSSPKSPKSTPLRALSMSKSQKKISKKVPKSVPCRSTIKPASSSRWKITKKDQKMHRLVYEKDGLPNGSEVAYYSQGKRLLQGYKTETGIYCLCCSSDVSPSQFEAHAGWASRRKPYNYIYTSNGVSLHEYAVALNLKRTKNSLRDNDDLCIICADGGDLLLCDGCPRSFHQECASLKTVPRGKWYCKFCQNMFQREKFVAHNANAVAAGRVLGVDVMGQITERCIRIVKNPEASEVFACVLCRGYDFSRTGFGPRTVILCDQCEREYHVGCLKKNKMADLKELPSGEWFCCSDCKRIHSDLQNLLVSGAEKLTDSLLGVTRKQHVDKGLECVTNVVVKWRLLSARISSRENKLLLSEACAIFHENFDPIVDVLSGRDYIPSMVYGRNIRGQDLSGMYCAILTVNSTVVSAGLLRIFGRDLAELPLVATTKENQGKGYFQLLFSCIEKLLAFLSVRTLVLPAAEEAETIWTKKFGFEKIPQEQLNNYRKKCWQMLTFEGTTMLEKAVPQCRIASQELTVSDVSHQGMSITEVSDQYMAVTKVSDRDFLAVPVVSDQDMTVPVVSNQDLAVPVVSDQDMAVPVVSDQDMAVTKVSEQDIAVMVTVEEKETSTSTDKDRAAEILEDVDATADI
ncbi:uncharacterized protein LOC141689220 isoform X1 [Apium graveolens]|uniref:uncharacterized protein LOC141689220 isoform X1 n=1 Tax=Apium graveolens TaxID=4045 RepID=UPI003D7BA86B